MSAMVALLEADEGGLERAAQACDMVMRCELSRFT